MINKIKDKQTGEYHDIGGLKCKLVAEGTFELVEEGSDMYKPIYQFKKEKYYTIRVFDSDGYEMACFTGLCTNEGMLSTPLLFDAVDNYLGLISYPEYTNFYTYDSEIKEVYNGYTYKVYELPFSLEV
jgi:hypothetical protein